MSNGAPECFVVMGYQKRTDPDSSKVYDLDKSYRSIIKQAVEDAGFKPIRSDEVTEPGMISRQMYQLLMNADLVVCDPMEALPHEPCAGQGREYSSRSWWRWRRLTAFRSVAMAARWQRARFDVLRR